MALPPIPGLVNLYNTRMGNDYLELSACSTDTHYSTSPSLVGCNYGSWPGSWWLARSCSNPSVGGLDDQTVTTTFTVPPFSVLTSLTGNFGADDEITSIKVNGVSVGLSGKTFPYSTYGSDSNEQKLTGFTTGTNTIEIIFKNLYPNTPFGLAVQWVSAEFKIYEQPKGPWQGYCG